MWTVPTLCFVMSVSTEMVPAQKILAIICMHMYMCWSVNLGMT